MDSGAIDDAIHWLERDRWGQGTGYQKEALWHHLRRAPLTSQQRSRLEGVALAYVRNRSSREFRYMCRAMVRIARPEFWRAVHELTRDQDVRVVQRAAFLASYADGCDEARAATSPGFVASLSRRCGLPFNGGEGRARPANED